MTLTIEQLREELHRELTPMRKEIRDLRTDVADLRGEMADLRVEVAKLPTRDDMRELVLDKTNAMKGNLLAWIAASAVAVTAALTAVVFGIAKLLE